MYTVKEWRSPSATSLAGVPTVSAFPCQNILYFPMYTLVLYMKFKYFYPLKISLLTLNELYFSSL